MDILIKGLPLPQEGEYDYHLTIRSDGKVEGTQQVGERIHTIHTWAIELPPHGRLIDADELQDILRLVLSLVISNELTEKEISLVHRTIGAISEAINDLDTVLEAST